MTINMMRTFDQTFHRNFKVEKTDFPKQNLDLEIGCGVGWHPIVYVKKHPDRYLIAIEHTANKFHKFYNRFMKNHSPQNLFPLHANAISFVSSCLENESLDRVYILYPNPYPLKRNLNKRFHNMPFMKILIDRLKIGGQIILATNERFYWEEARDVFQVQWGLILLEEIDLSQVSAFSARTHFEKKYLERGETCVQLSFGKASF